VKQSVETDKLRNFSFKNFRTCDYWQEVALKELANRTRITENQFARLELKN